MTTSKTPRAAIYLRYSSEMQDEATLETQRVECKTKAEQLGAVVIAEYSDEAQTGRADDREHFQRMIAAAKRGEFDLIIVRKYSRFARDVMASRVYKALLEKHGVKVISVHEPGGGDSPTERLMEGLIELLDEFYSKNLAQETKAGQITTIRRGFRAGGTAPYGYRNIRVPDQATGKTRTKMEIDPIEADAVKLIFQRYSDGKGLAAIALELNERGVKPRRAKAWSKSVLHYMLGWEVYRGILIYRATGKNNPDGWIRSAGGCPEIVDAQIWHTVQERRERNKKLGIIGRAQCANVPLSGVLVCGECGSAFHYSSEAFDSRYFRCAGRIKRGKTCPNTRSIPEAWLVGELRRLLQEQLFTPEALSKAFNAVALEAEAAAIERGPRIDAITKRIEHTEGQIQRLVEILSGDDAPRNAIMKKICELEERQEKFRAALAEEMAADDRAASLRLSKDDARQMAASLAALLDETDGAILRDVFHRLGVRVTIWPDHLKIETAPISEAVSARTCGIDGAQGGT